ncbi:ligand-binding sensor domain-containing protein [Aliidiomarina sanyensis]|uniref:diguanylate cyclase n=1 Tax=Aliidiomarina sanyensis TaxID=1249555 RepID=A0A432WAK9_9GAMM|nr:ligand-binding sensor domain-containing diguanylate cyclase [Aliidiomarina sanyensis]RUO27444.1 hypothetical protein CWE11_11705 [Aliidiomarina sanyensis]
MKKLMCLLGLVCCVFLGVSLDSRAGEAVPEAKPLIQYAIETWSTRHGLPHNSVNRITQSNDGYIWLATWEGPVRFNGREFTIYDDFHVTALAESGVYDITKDETSDAVYVGGPRGGVSRYLDGQWHGLPRASDFVYETLSTPNGELWVAVADGAVYRYFPDNTFRVYGIEQGITADIAHRIYLGPSGGIWLGGSDGIYRYDADTDGFTHFASFPAEFVRAILELDDGRIIAASDSGLFVSEPHHDAFVPWPADIQGVITSLLQDRYGHIWFGTFDRGLGRISPGTVDYLDVSQGLPNQHILDIFEDREGNIWVSSHGGLVQLRDALFNTFSMTQGLVGNFVRTVQEDHDGYIWVGTNAGLNRLARGQILPVSDDLRLEGQSVLSLFPHTDGRMYVGTYVSGLLQVTDGQVTAQFDRGRGLPFSEIRGLYALPDSNRLFAGTPGGVVEFETEQGDIRYVRTYTQEDGLVANFISGLAYDHGTLWVISTYGLSRMFQVDGAWQAETVDLSRFSSAMTLFAVYVGDQFTYFSSDRGLLIYQRDRDKWFWLNRENGLPFEKYFSVAEDQDKHLWIGGSRGILRLSREAIQSFISDETALVSPMLFTESDGLLSHQVNSGGPSSILDSRNRMWFATAMGASYIVPGDVLNSGLEPPPVVIERARTDFEALGQGERLPPSTSRLEFQYAGLGFRMSSQIEYQVRLIGFDADWVSRGRALAAEYTALPPGQYTFSVRARYPGGEWSEPAELPFEIEAHYWQQMWFYLLLTVLLSFMVVGVMKWRVRYLEQARETLQAQVAEKTRELESLAREDSLTGLANRRAFDEVLRHQYKKAERSNEPLCLAVLDIDHFKAINDRFLHAVGDLVLIEIAKVLRATVRSHDYVARWGGEEFAILLPNTRLREATDICERIRSNIEAMDFSHIREGLIVTLSGGVADRHENSGHSNLLVRADKALYQAKTEGRNRIVQAPSGKQKKS